MLEPYGSYDAVVYDSVEMENDMLLKERAYKKVCAELLQFLRFSPITTGSIWLLMT